MATSKHLKCKPTAAEKKKINAKIPILRAEGYPQKQAIAIAYSMVLARRRTKKRKKR